MQAREELLRNGSISGATAASGDSNGWGASYRLEVALTFPQVIMATLPFGTTTGDYEGQPKAMLQHNTADLPVSGSITMQAAPNALSSQVRQLLRAGIAAAARLPPRSVTLERIGSGCSGGSDPDAADCTGGGSRGVDDGCGSRGDNGGIGLTVDMHVRLGADRAAGDRLICQLEVTPEAMCNLDPASEPPARDVLLPQA